MPIPYVTVRADRSAASIAARSCAGNARGGRGSATNGGRHPPGGGAVGGGPWYGAGPASGAGAGTAASSSGRRQ